MSVGVDLRRGMTSTKRNQTWQIQAVTFIFCIHRRISNSKIQDKGKEHLKVLKCILLQDLTVLQHKSQTIQIKCCFWEIAFYLTFGLTDEDKNGDRKFVRNLYLLVLGVSSSRVHEDEVCRQAQDTTLQVSTEFLLKNYLT